MFSVEKIQFLLYFAALFFPFFEGVHFDAVFEEVFFRTKRMSPSVGMTALNAEGKTSLPLSSTLAVYSPMKVVMVKNL